MNHFVVKDVPNEPFFHFKKYAKLFVDLANVPKQIPVHPYSINVKCLCNIQTDKRLGMFFYLTSLKLQASQYICCGQSNGF